VEEEVTRQTFTFAVDKEKLRKAELRDGHYLLRSNLTAEDPGVLWERYVQLTHIEAAFKTMKSELGRCVRFITVSATAWKHLFWWRFWLTVCW
jgi:hypothetical protein